MYVGKFPLQRERRWENSADIGVLKSWEGLSVDESGPGSCPVADFGESNVELSASICIKASRSAKTYN